MRANSRMKALWRDSEFLPEGKLPGELRDLLREGWEVGPAHSLVLEGMFGSGWGVGWLTDEVAHHEIEVNDVWIPSAGFPSRREAYLVAAVDCARSFAVLAMQRARHFAAQRELVSVISVGVDADYRTHGAVVKFFTTRGDYPRLYEDLERYQGEAMAVLDYSDINK